MKTKTFNVLEQTCDLKGRFLLEASAGTGKTFSIENIVLRKILEGCELTSVLAVTFTKAAATDLKVRIRSNLEKALIKLNHPNSAEEGFYKEFIVSEELLKKAQKRVKYALSSFEQAQIYTIHGFCLKMLKESFFEANLGGILESESSFSDQEFLRVIRDFLRLELHPHLYCPEQIEILIGGEGTEKLEKKIKDEISKGVWKNTASYQDLLKKFDEKLNQLKSMFDLELVEEDLLKLNNARKPETKLRFEKNVREFLEICLGPSADLGLRKLIKKGWEFSELKIKKGLSLHYPHFLEFFNKEVYPIVQEARHKTFILSRLIFYAQKFILRYLKKEEKFRFDDLLENASDAVKSPLFCEKIQNQYQVVVIDEFQDTDPYQWNIFNALFGEKWKGDLFLVGDPKQSIYGFRRADIYTYLNAAKSIDSAKHLSLKTNFRSQPSLIQCLNELFLHCEQLFRLPKQDTELCYEPVEAGAKIQDLDFKDGKGAVHFFYIQAEKKEKDKEATTFFAYIAEEIAKLRQSLNIPYHQFAILVSRHQQADQLRSCFQRWNIPSVLQRSKNLYETSAYYRMKDLLKAVLNPRSESLVKIALGGEIFGYDHERLIELNDLDELSKVLFLFSEYHQILTDKGFADFYLKLFCTTLQEGKGTVLENLLMKEGGKEFYANFSQIAEELIEFQTLNKASPPSLLEYLKEFEFLDTSDGDFLKCRRDPNEEAVQILTIHSSKGLEYEIVFALGLADKSSRPLEPIFQGPEGFTPLLDPENSLEHRLYCEELDEERMRQLYVAMTRAKYRLYLPCLFYTENRSIGPGRCSSMELFMAKWSSLQSLSSDLYERVNSLKAEHLLNFITTKGHASFTSEDITFKIFKNDFTPQKEEKKIVAPKEFQINLKPLQMHSYSSLARHLASSVPQRTNLTPPHDWKTEEKSIHTIPAGNLTGNLLHQLFQELPFAISKDRQKIEDWLQTSLPLIYLEWKEILADLIFQTMHTKIGEQFILADLKEEQTFREMEFLYPIEDKGLIEEFTLEDGYLKGVIDLIFESEGKYFIVDWKSNWLGPNADAYQAGAISQAMMDHAYLLQASIYRQALKSYLEMIQPLPFEEIFGGTYYIFVRGCENLQTQGKYFITS